MNTIDGPRSSHPEDYLRSYADLIRWGRHAGILDDDAASHLLREGTRRKGEAATIFEQALALRGALTRIFRAIAHGHAVDAADLQHLRAEYLTALAHARLDRADDGYHWTWDAADEALERPLWAVARSAVELLTEEELARVKECPGAGGCGWLFYDTSKNGSRRWCSMEGCGSRVKMRKQYARHRDAQEGSALSLQAPRGPQHGVPNA